jgi:putative ABC transport system permease protein
MSPRRATTRLFSLALRAFPRAERTAFAADAIETFERALTARHSEGGRAALRFVFAACLDAVQAGFGERRRLAYGRITRQGGAMRIRISWLDVKLGLRMLARYPGLSIAGGLGIVLVILCGTVAGIFDSVINGTLPFEDADRIVAIENRDTSRNEPAAHDFEWWRDLKTVRNVGAYRIVSRNIAAPDRPPEPVRMAEISASAFTIARVPPLMGRYLVAGDEGSGAAPVVVIREDEWQGRFAGNPEIVGLSVQAGGAPATIVGVMPKAFGFPVNERYWMPLHLEPSDYTNRPAPSNMPYKSMPHGVVHVFGRLADGADLAGAQAELDVIGQRLAADEAATHAHIRPRVLP